MRIAALLCTAALVTSACVSTPTVDPVDLPAGQWELDELHASLIWRVGHGNGLSRFTGRFDRFNASLTFDPANPEASRLTAVIDPASVNTNVERLDERLRETGDALDVANHPQIVFEATDISVTGDATGTATGTLTLLGVSAPVSMDITFNGGAFSSFSRKDKIGFSASGTLDRTVYGASAWSNFGVGTDVSFEIDVEFERVGEAVGLTN